MNLHGVSHHSQQDVSNQSHRRERALTHHAQSSACASGRPNVTRSNAFMSLWIAQLALYYLVWPFAHGFWGWGHVTSNSTGEFVQVAPAHMTFDINTALPFEFFSQLCIVIWLVAFYYFCYMLFFSICQIRPVTHVRVCDWWPRFSLHYHWLCAECNASALITVQCASIISMLLFYYYHLLM